MKTLGHVILVLIFLWIGTAGAQDRVLHKSPAPYLAQGDSIPFGYNPFLADLPTTRTPKLTEHC
jgi:hypothetical protein